MQKHPESRESTLVIIIVPGSDAPAVARCREIRERVFCEEQGVSVELEWDGLDPQCHHILALAGDLACGTSRIRTLANPNLGKIERVAVIRSMRGNGIGQAMMLRACAQLAEWGCRTAVLNAQTSVRAFYESLDFTAEGDVFEEANIPHIHMRKSLDP